MFRLLNPARRRNLPLSDPAMLRDPGQRDKSGISAQGLKTRSRRATVRDDTIRATFCARTLRHTPCLETQNDLTFRETKPKLLLARDSVQNITPETFSRRSVAITWIYYKQSQVSSFAPLCFWPWLFRGATRTCRPHIRHSTQHSPDQQDEDSSGVHVEGHAPKDIP
jgi:hypothetical protein